MYIYDNNIIMKEICIIYDNFFVIYFSEIDINLKEYLVFIYLNN